MGRGPRANASRSMASSCDGEMAAAVALPGAPIELRSAICHRTECVPDLRRALAVRSSMARRRARARWLDSPPRRWARDHTLIDHDGRGVLTKRHVRRADSFSELDPRSSPTLQARWCPTCYGKGSRSTKWMERGTQKTARKITCRFVLEWLRSTTVPGVRGQALESRALRCVSAPVDLRTSPPCGGRLERFFHHSR